MDYDISAYDAAYLELAGRKKAVLCTLDENLQRAADKYGDHPEVAFTFLGYLLLLAQNTF